MKSEWPEVLPNDDGIRPAGRPDQCFYCHAMVGQPHGRDCDVVTKTVRLRYQIEVDVEVPWDWDEDMILFHRNDSSWCADNALDEMEAMRKDGYCLCGRLTCEMVGVVDNRPHRNVKPPQPEIP